MLFLFKCSIRVWHNINKKKLRSVFQFHLDTNCRIATTNDDNSVYNVNCSALCCACADYRVWCDEQVANVCNYPPGLGLGAMTENVILLIGKPPPPQRGCPLAWVYKFKALPKKAKALSLNSLQRRNQDMDWISVARALPFCILDDEILTQREREREKTELHVVCVGIGLGYFKCWRGMYMWCSISSTMYRCVMQHSYG